MTEYERGFAAGVEAAANALAAPFIGLGWWERSQAQRVVLALRPSPAPSPVRLHSKGPVPPDTAPPLPGHFASRAPVPIPKEDAPRCEACEGHGAGPIGTDECRVCAACHGTGRSPDTTPTNGGGK